MRSKKIYSLTLGLWFLSGLAQAEDLNKIFAKVNELVAAQNYSKALEELGWAKTEIEKMHTSRLKSFLPDTVGEWKGAAAKETAMMGMLNIERNYSNGANKLEVSLLGGSKGPAGANPLAGLAGLGQMAAMFGQGEGMESFRIDGRTASYDENSQELTVFLDSGFMLKLKGSDKESMTQFATSLKLSDMESYLKG